MTILAFLGSTPGRWTRAIVGAVLIVLPTALRSNLPDQPLDIRAGQTVGEQSEFQQSGIVIVFAAIGVLFTHACGP